MLIIERFSSSAHTKMYNQLNFQWVKDENGKVLGHLEPQEQNQGSLFYILHPVERCRRDEGHLPKRYSLIFLFWRCRINLLSSIPQFFKAINVLFSHNLHFKSRSNGPTQYFYTCQKTWQDGNCLIELYSTSVWRHLYLLCFPAHLSGALSGSRAQGRVRVTSKLITRKIAH